jgi:hypothetical protein
MGKRAKVHKRSIRPLQKPPSSNPNKQHYHLPPTPIIYCNLPHPHTTEKKLLVMPDCRYTHNIHWHDTTPTPAAAAAASASVASAAKKKKSQKPS